MDTYEELDLVITARENDLMAAFDLADGGRKAYVLGAQFSRGNYGMVRSKFDYPVTLDKVKQDKDTIMVGHKGKVLYKNPNILLLSDGTHNIVFADYLKAYEDGRLQPSFEAKATKKDTKNVPS